MTDKRALLREVFGYPGFRPGQERLVAARRPADRAALLTVTGVGEVKCSRYGKAFLEVIARHRGD